MIKKNDYNLIHEHHLLDLEIASISHGFIGLLTTLLV